MIILYYSLSFSHKGSTHALIFYFIFIIIMHLYLRFILLPIYKHFLRNYFTLFVNFFSLIFLVILNSSQIRTYRILSERLHPSLSVLATSHRKTTCMFMISFKSTWSNNLIVILNPIFRNLCNFFKKFLIRLLFIFCIKLVSFIFSKSIIA